MRTGVKVTRIASRAGRRPSRSLAVFAHNESGRIGAALQSIVQAAAGIDVEVWVLANGCTDATSDEVRACATVLPDLWLAEIDVADKANAWNVFVHELIMPERAREIETYFFMDGDVTLERDALALLASSLDDVPTAQAAGGMPATGRDRDSWRARMVRNGTLAGNLYALRPISSTRCGSSGPSCRWASYSRIRWCLGWSRPSSDGRNRRSDKLNASSARTRSSRSGRCR